MAPNDTALKSLFWLVLNLESKSANDGSLVLTGEALKGWRVFPLDLANIQDVRYSRQPHRLTARAQPSAAKDGPIIYRQALAEFVWKPGGHLKYRLRASPGLVIFALR